MPDPKRSRLRQSVRMRFVIRVVRSTPHRLATVPTPNTAIRTLLGNDTARVIVSEFVRFSWRSRFSVVQRTYVVPVPPGQRVIRTPLRVQTNASGPTPVIRLLQESPGLATIANKEPARWKAGAL